MVPTGNKTNGDIGGGGGNNQKKWIPNMLIWEWQESEKGAPLICSNIMIISGSL